MLHNKDIKNLSELTSTFCDHHNTADFMSNMLKVLKIGKLHSIFSGVKTKGISALSLIEILLCFPFMNVKTVEQFRYSPWQDIFSYGKDCYYRLLCHPKINWRGFLLGLVKQSLPAFEQNHHRHKAFVIDDSTIVKTGHHIEGVSKVWNHVLHKRILGYQLLVLGIYYGTLFVPIDFSFHREKGSNKRFCFGLKPKHYKSQHRKKRDNNTFGYQRKKELDSTKTDNAIKMLKRAVFRGIDAKYVLTDSWFSCIELIKVAVANQLTFIGMYSKVKTKFDYRGKPLTYKAIRKLKRKNIKRSKTHNLYYIRSVVKYKDIPVVLYHTRKGKNGNWRVLLSTELCSNFTQTVNIYQIRWSIEVFFKEAKQLLGLGKNQSTDFDTQIAATTLTMVQHIFLSIKRHQENYQTLGGLFKAKEAEWLELTLYQRLLKLIIELINEIEKLLGEQQQEQIIAKIIEHPETVNKLKFMFQPNLKGVA
jgi:hypothetical protein